MLFGLYFLSPASWRSWAKGPCKKKWKQKPPTQEGTRKHKWEQKLPGAKDPTLWPTKPCREPAKVRQRWSWFISFNLTSTHVSMMFMNCWAMPDTQGHSKRMHKQWGRLTNWLKKKTRREYRIQRLTRIFCEDFCESSHKIEEATCKLESKNNSSSKTCRFPIVLKAWQGNPAIYKSTSGMSLPLWWTLLWRISGLWFAGKVFLTSSSMSLAKTCWSGIPTLFNAIMWTSIPTQYRL